MTLPTKDVVWCIPHQCGEVEHKWWDDEYTHFVCLVASEFPVAEKCVPTWVKLVEVGEEQT